jgi:membrane protein DedA with SNARE-associated domain
VEQILSTLQPYLDHYGYLTVLVAIFLEDFGVPLPGETLLIAGALLATGGKLNIYLLMTVAWTGAVLGDNVGYLIGRLGGRRLVLHFGKYVLITPKRLEYAEEFFHRRGAIIVIVARFIEILRQLNGIIAGIANMPWGRFLSYNGIGAALWVGLWSMLFYQLGNRGQQIGLLFKRYEPFALIALAAIAVAIALNRFILRRRTSTRAPGSEGPNPSQNTHSDRQE